jgi:hypothetical protein
VDLALRCAQTDEGNESQAMHVTMAIDRNAGKGMDGSRLAARGLEFMIQEMTGFGVYLAKSGKPVHGRVGGRILPCGIKVGEISLDRSPRIAPLNRNGTTSPLRAD